MKPTQTYYIQTIQDDLQRRQQDNPSYSLRAYARDVGMNPSSLSQVLKGKRPLPARDAETIAKRLKLNSVERTRFMESVLRTGTSLDQIKIVEVDDRLILDETHYDVIAQWEHYAALELFDLTDFRVDRASIARRLKITPERTDEVVANLIRAKFIKQHPDGHFVRIQGDFKTTEDVSMAALRESHLETLEMAMQKLEVAVELRDFSSATYAIDPDKLGEVKTIIREFRMKMGALLASGEKKEIYQLGIQFFPLTELQQDRP